VLEQAILINKTFGCYDSYIIKCSPIGKHYKKNKVDKKFEAAEILSADYKKEFRGLKRNGQSYQYQKAY